VKLPCACTGSAHCCRPHVALLPRVPALELSPVCAVLVTLRSACWPPVWAPCGGAPWQGHVLLGLFASHSRPQHRVHAYYYGFNDGNVPPSPVGHPAKTTLLRSDLRVLGRSGDVGTALAAAASAQANVGPSETDAFTKHSDLAQVLMARDHWQDGANGAVPAVDDLLARNCSQQMRLIAVCDKFFRCAPCPLPRVD
jgi:hypothetical protein